MNLGIVIAVSAYEMPSNNLHGCDADGLAISKILKNDNKFNDVLYISKNTNSGNVKPELIKFINNHKDSDIGDIVFYFTGHGDFSGDEFYYLLSDYDKKRKKQTSLENTELDNLLKTLKPHNTVKIVDACHSGTPYIKDPEAFDTYLKGTQGEFKKCYFMFSSQIDQYSYQDNKLSFFTKSIVQSVQQHTSETIRYKDVIDYVSDSFSESHSQTPFFIVQADFTESFCTLSDTLRQSLTDLLSDDASESEAKENDNSEQYEKSLLDLVKEDALRYCTEEEAQSYLSKFLIGLREVPLNEQIVDLYEISFDEISEYSEIPNPTAIGKWLDSNDHSFFAQPFKKEIMVRRRVLKDPMKSVMRIGSAISSYLIDDNNYEDVTKMEKCIKGFKFTVDIPVKLLKITIESEFLNLNSVVAFIVPVISKTEMRVFFSFNFCEQKDWKEKKIEGSVKWLTEIVDIKNKESQSKLVLKIMTDFSTFAYTPIAEKFNLIEPVEEGEIDTDKTNKVAPVAP